jgi:hypothetical protein
MEFTKAELRRYNRNEKEFFAYLRRKLCLPEPKAKEAAEGTVFYWDDHQPHRRLRAFTPRV